MTDIPYEVSIKIMRILGRGICPNGLKVGDTFSVDEKGAVKGLCGSAFHAIFPYLMVLRYGGNFPWEDDKDKATISCPDPKNPVIFEMERKKRNKEL